LLGYRRRRKRRVWDIDSGERRGDKGARSMKLLEREEEGGRGWEK
jgi:hypothetical protein